MDIEATRKDISGILEGVIPEAIALYGSQVAGYAKPDSDYDVLALVNGLNGKLRYIYQKGQAAEFSVLLVDVNEALKDADQASMGEFVAGRLLNPFIPIYGENTVKDLEVRYKERVIREESSELFSQYGYFTYHLNIPLHYFLFSRLKKRYRIYPPALYSYAMTYSEERMGKNLEMSIPGFRQAASRIDYLELKGDAVRIKDGSKINAMPLRDDFELFERAVKQYIFHGISGKVGPDVVVSEALSKIKRRRTIKAVNPYLKKPELMLVIEGVHLLYSGSPEREFFGSGALSSGIRQSVGLKVGTLNGKKYVIKRFTGSKHLKWYFLGMIGRPIKPFDVSPLQRMYNEYCGTMELERMGFRVPRIEAVSVKRPTIIKEYVEGETVLHGIKAFFRSGSDGEIITGTGELLRRLHDRGVVLGDSKPENFLVNKEGIHLIDLEQSKINASVQDKGWDVAEFLYYSLSFSAKKEMAIRFYELFFKGYGNDRSVFQEAVAQKYSVPFLLITRADMLSYYRDTLLKFLNAKGEQ
ncbi:MAG: hypothetical protein M1291_01270 [Thaumarchaeota archaeon]|jgi:Kae1-associated kinase Bud32|nr:hypothetical protein [Nitrososphaerota archaeon]